MHDELAQETMNAASGGKEQGGRMVAFRECTNCHYMENEYVPQKLIDMGAAYHTKKCPKCGEMTFAFRKTVLAVQV